MQQKRLREERNPLLNFLIFLVLYSRLQRFFCLDLELNRVSFVWGGFDYHGNAVRSLSLLSLED